MRNQSNHQLKNGKTISNAMCDLCGLRLPKNPYLLNHNNQTLSFCCNGCRHVFSILSESGMLESDYRKSELYQNFLKMGLIGNTEDYVEKEKLDTVDLENSAELDLHIDGMWCSSCSWLIEKTMQSKQGVIHAKVIYASDTAKIFYKPDIISSENLISAVNKLGYKASSREVASKVQAEERNSLLLKMGIALFLWMNIMFFSYVLYIGYFETLSTKITRIVPLILLVLTIPVVFWCGYPIHKKAYSSLLGRAPTMELLISISVFSSFFYSVYSLFAGYDNYYFDTATSLVALLLIGKFVEFNAKSKTTQNIHRLYEMLPKKVRLKTNEGERLVSVKKLKIGDLFFVKSGEKIPTDGMVVKGNAVVDESLLTGESYPVEKCVGDMVIGSSMANSGAIEVQVMRIGDDTIFSGIIKMVENALSQKTPLEKSVDKVAKVFIPLVLIIALATAGYLFYSGYGTETTLLRAITVLVIACPCALGMATPLAIAAGIGYAAKLGILIKDGGAFQTARKLKTIFFDKTGTLTEGKFELRKFSHSGDEEQLYFQIIASIEQNSNHPIAEAIVRESQSAGLTLFNSTDVELKEGIGILGNVDDKNNCFRVAIGNPDLLLREGFELSNFFHSESQKEASKGYTVIFFGIEPISDRIAGNSKVIGYLALGDVLKSGVIETIKKLNNRGIKVRLLSGDDHTTTKAIARQAGIQEYSARALPNDKIRIINELQRSGNLVGMVGDGVNDAPALAQADLGMAIGGGTQVAIESAPITLIRDDIRLVNEAIDISRRTVNTLSQNLIWAFLYNSIGMVVAISGFLNPLMAASAMLISSLSVVGNSLRLKEGRGKCGRKILEFLVPWIEVDDTMKKSALGQSSIEQTSKK